MYIVQLILGHVLFTLKVVWVCNLKYDDQHHDKIINTSCFQLKPTIIITFDFAKIVDR